MMVDNGSLANIIYGATFDKMEVGHELTLITSPLYGFKGDSIIPRGKITLAMKMRVARLKGHHFIEFLVVDHLSAYHGGTWEVHSERIMGTYFYPPPMYKVPNRE